MSAASTLKEDEEQEESFEIEDNEDLSSDSLSATLRDVLLLDTSSSMITASGLELRLPRLVNRLAESKSKYFEEMSPVVSEIEKYKDTAEDIQRRAQSLEERTDIIKNKFDNPEDGIKLRLLSVDDNLRDVQDQMESTQNVIDTLQHMRKFSEIAAFDEVPERLRDRSDVIIFHQMKETLSQRKSVLKSKLNSLWKRSIKIEPHSLTLSDEEIDLDDLVLCLNNYDVEYLRGKLAEFSSNLMTQILEPILSVVDHEIRVEDKENITLIQFITKEGDKIEKKTKNKNRAESFTPNDFTTDLKHIERVLTRIYAKLRDDDETMRKIMSGLWDPLSTSILFRLHSIQSDLLEELEAIPGSVGELDRQMRDMGCGEFGGLSNVVGDVQILYDSKKRVQLLEKTREAALTDDHTLLTVSAVESIVDLLHTEEGDTSPFCIGARETSNSTVSKRFSSFITLLRSSLDRATTGPPERFSNAYEAVRSAIDLYVSVVPTETLVPSLGMVFVNECNCLAFVLPLLAVLLPETLSEGVSLVDYVPIFRNMADRQLSAQLERQKHVLLQVFDGWSGLADTHDPSSFNSVKKTIQRLLHELELLSKLWKEICTGPLYLFLMGNMVDAVLERFTKELLSLKDISEEETHSLHRLLTLLFDVRKFFVSKGATVDINRFSYKFLRFWKVTEVLELSLSDITTNYKNGHYVEFTPKELRELIVSLFSDSPKRKDLVMVDIVCIAGRMSHEFTWFVSDTSTPLPVSPFKRVANKPDATNRKDDNATVPTYESIAPIECKTFSCELSCTLEELYTGILKKVTVTKVMRSSCSDANVMQGDGSSKQLSVVVKKGYKDGTSLNFPKEEITLIIEEQKHSTFERRRDDLYYKANVSLEEALTGTTINLKTLDGRALRIAVNDIVKPDSIKKVVGEGMPVLASSVSVDKEQDERGDLYIQFCVEFPISLTAGQKQLIHQAFKH
ncbi:DnaJ-like protein subfamily b member 13 [Planoprotostelium fungivorum]|uniref:DnaJ-like protein subfamily b member 13 n=1 Tax=Planoprotostelium fungivorum TaxID=1890364 RepID=A0A2P6NI41_9EUKA|nr:DnaJ-like protein subfamily b member 13 [Planoprotostelium fungivorum]